MREIVGPLGVNLSVPDQVIRYLGESARSYRSMNIDYRLGIVEAYANQYRVQLG